MRLASRKCVNPQNSVACLCLRLSAYVIMLKRNAIILANATAVYARHEKAPVIYSDKTAPFGHSYRVSTRKA